jgi:hypothetical protein
MTSGVLNPAYPAGVADPVYPVALIKIQDDRISTIGFAGRISRII